MFAELTQLRQAARARGSDPRQVPAEALSETVVFEFLDPIGAKRLGELLHPHRHIRICEFEGAALVAAELRPEAGDLAALLRSVKLWLDEAGCGLVRFHLDGRVYDFESRRAICPA